MDIQRQPKSTPIWKKYWYLGALALVVSFGIVGKSFLGNASYIVERNKLLTAKVEKGEFIVNVRANGVLKPQFIRWVSTRVTGRVEQSLVKPGAHVKKGQTLIQLSNPELHRELEQAKWELAATKAESNATLVSLESQLLDMENTVVEAEFSYQSAKLKLDAETELLRQNEGAVSALDYQRSQLQVEQQLQFWQSRQNRVAKMKANLVATKQAQSARLGLVENNYSRVQAQVEALTVKATTEGVVQQVSLELGERAQIGEPVVLIANQDALYAELQVQEVRVSDILVGQSVVVDTRSSQLTGRVSRIDPAVDAGMVQVDVELVGELPQEARPDLTVDGLIEISNIPDALFVKRPAFAPKYNTAGLFVIDEAQQFANKHSVQLGQSSVNQIQILSGLNVGDKVVISDTSDWQEHQQIMLN